MFAAREGDLESAKLLLDAGADINQTTEYGWTPLLTATNNRHYELGKYLIEHGADVNKANKGNWTPLYLATDNRNIEGGDYPVPKPDMDHLEYIKLLLEHGAKPNSAAKDNTLTRTIFTMQWFFEDGGTPFVRAAQSSDIELMQLLLDCGADPMITTASRRHRADCRRRHRLGGRRDLRAVCEREPRSRQDACSTSGCDPNGANRDGRTPLMVAALKGRTKWCSCSWTTAPNSISATTAAATPKPRLPSSPATRGKRSTTPTASSGSACSPPSPVRKRPPLIRKLMTERGTDGSSAESRGRLHLRRRTVFGTRRAGYQPTLGNRGHIRSHGGTENTEKD